MDSAESRPHDAGKAFLKGSAKQLFDSDESNVCFCKNILIHEVGGYTKYLPMGVVLLEDATEANIYDEWIRKVSNEGHQNVVAEMFELLYAYAYQQSHYTPFLASTGGHTPFKEVVGFPKGQS